MTRVMVRDLDRVSLSRLEESRWLRQDGIDSDPPRDFRDDPTEAELRELDERERVAA